MSQRKRDKPTRNAPVHESTAAIALSSGPVEDEEIRSVAHQYWVDRGCPIGTPEEDWLRAEADVRSRRAQSQGLHGNEPSK